MLPGITRTYVIAESGSYGISPDPQAGKPQAAIRSAVEAVKDIYPICVVGHRGSKAVSVRWMISCSMDIYFPETVHFYP